MAQQKSMTVIIGGAGGFAGALVGFLFRPSAFLIGQLSFETVITRGANLTGIDELLIPIAQRSFNILVAGLVIGAIIGLVVGYVIDQKKT